MNVLVIAEHNNQTLNPAVRHAVSAAAKLGSVHLLVAGSGAVAVAEQAVKVAGVEKVLLADAPHYAEALAEDSRPWSCRWLPITGTSSPLPMPSAKI